MCFYSTDREIKTASKDIPCYKIAEYHNNEITSHVYNYPYEIGKTYKDECGMRVSKWGINACVTRAFHSYSATKTEIQLGVFCSVLHNGRRIDTVSSCFGSGIVQLNCTIPKGSQYMENEVGELVSDCLRIDDVVILFNEKDMFTTYNFMQFRIRCVRSPHNPKERVFVAAETLQKMLYNDEKGYDSPAAKILDESIYCYVSDEAIGFTHKALEEYVRKNFD